MRLHVAEVSEQRVKNERRKCEMQEYSADGRVDSAYPLIQYFLFNVYTGKFYICIPEYLVLSPPNS